MKSVLLPTPRDSRHGHQQQLPSLSDLTSWWFYSLYIGTSGGFRCGPIRLQPHFHQLIWALWKLEIRSMEWGICPIATLALRLTLYSLTGSRVWPLWSLDVIGHMTIGTPDGPFLLVVCWCQVTISHGCRDIEHQTFRARDLDPFGSRDDWNRRWSFPIGHPLTPCPYLAPLLRY